jgi:hypothetical protein
MIVEKQLECILAGETEVLGENLPQRHFWYYIYIFAKGHRIIKNTLKSREQTCGLGFEPGTSRIRNTRAKTRSKV